MGVKIHFLSERATIWQLSWHMLINIITKIFWWFIHKKMAERIRIDFFENRLHELHYLFKDCFILQNMKTFSKHTAAYLQLYECWPCIRRHKPNCFHWGCLYSILFKLKIYFKFYINATLNKGTFREFSTTLPLLYFLKKHLF